MKSKKEIRDWLLQNAVDDNGDLNLDGLDFSDFDGDVRTSYMKVKNNLYQYNQKVGGDLLQYSQKVGGGLLQNSQKVGGELLQNSQKVKGTLYQHSQEVGGDLWENKTSIFDFERN